MRQTKAKYVLRLTTPSTRKVGHHHDSRLDTLFLTMTISWRGTLHQYVGRLHQFHGGKRVVRVYDYVDAYIPMLARMYEKRLKRDCARGHELEGKPDNDADA